MFQYDFAFHVSLSQPPKSLMFNCSYYGLLRCTSYTLEPYQHRRFWYASKSTKSIYIMLMLCNSHGNTLFLNNIYSHKTHNHSSLTVVCLLPLLSIQQTENIQNFRVRTNNFHLVSIINKRNSVERKYTIAVH